jgi:hypothetical protein
MLFAKSIESALGGSPKADEAGLASTVADTISHG